MLRALGRSQWLANKGACDFLAVSRQSTSSSDGQKTAGGFEFFSSVSQGRLPGLVVNTFDCVA